MARKNTSIPGNMTPIRKRMARTKAASEAMAETTTCDGTFVPLDPVQRYEWDRMWDMIYAKMLPRVIERVQAKIQQERRAA